MRPSFARSDHGQAWYAVLSDLAMTPQEWGELTADQRRFLQNAHNERQQRRADEYENA